ncbi:MAG: hypothetical protein HY738_07125 [Bacteroidia bacterium]|nr:hypothetical protein [Bacteroidia bacterium]
MKQLYKIKTLLILFLLGYSFSQGYSQVTTHTGVIWNLIGPNQGAWDLVANVGLSSGASSTLKDMKNTTTVASPAPYIFNNEWTAMNTTLFVKNNSFDYINTTLYSVVDAAYNAGSPVSTVSNVAVNDIYIVKLRGTSDYAVLKVTNITLTSSDNLDKIDFEYKKNFVAASYCSVYAICDEYIYQVQVGSINNISNCTSGGYEDYTGLSTDMTIGQSYSITVINGYGYLSDECGIWVDWNQDADFNDVNETIVVSNSPGNGELLGDGPYTATITPSGGANTGPTRIRIRIVWAETPSPCDSSTWGETEDYTINVVPISGHQTYYTCSDIFYDSGGASGNYSNNENYMVTYTSSNYTCIRAVIDFYNIETNFDYLYIYNGTSDSSPLLVLRQFNFKTSQVLETCEVWIKKLFSMFHF